MTQDEALAWLRTGASIFLTGQPGSGKTHTVNRYTSALARAGVPCAYTASTGIAATHGNGITVHAWSGIGVRDALTKRDLDAIARNRRIAARIERTQVLIIDEISMLPAQSLALVDAVCRHVKGMKAPFGGMQIVLVGDFFQLPPVARRAQEREAHLFADGAYAAQFAHASQAWRDLAPTVCYLSEQHRQDDKPFLDVLAAIRANDCNGAHRERLAARRIDPERLPEDCTRLFTHNAAVDEINKRQLAKLGGDTHVFTMAAKGPDPFVQALKRGCLSPEALALKKDAVVMFTKNDPAGRYVNGTLGTVESFDADEGYPVVCTRGGKRIVAEPTKWKIEEGGKERASVVQVPLRLAWAITVHKSQGMSLDAAVVDLSRAFEYGQGYVALSRVRRLDGLHLLGLNERALRVHPEAVEMDAAFRAASDTARLAVPEDAGAPVLDASVQAKSYDVAAIREVHAKAYAPWSEAEEDDLKRRFAAGESVKDIAAALGRKPGGITSRLKKLALM